jgi:D-glycero-D-manno-heptose 1,7-bisphosphate phosphatase
MGKFMATPAEGWTIFLDRDGTVIHDVGYPSDPQQVRLLPGAGEALAQLQQQGFHLILISNQSGIGRGLITEDQALQVHRRVLASLAQCGVSVDAAYYCRHGPEDGCSCRKPMPGMLLRAAEELDLDLSRAFMIGDKSSDIEAGMRAGCRTILLTTTLELEACDPRPEATVIDWLQVLQYIELHVSATG